MISEEISEILAKIKNNQISKEEGYALIKAFTTERRNDDVSVSSKKEVKSDNNLTKLVEKDLCQILHELIKVDLNDIDPIEEIKEYGLESILQVEFVERINEKLGVDCAPVVFYELESQNLHELSNYLMKEYESVLRKHYKVGKISDVSKESANILDEIIDILSNILKLECSEFDVDEDLREYGIDSILQVKIVEEINLKFDINCTPTIFFELENATIRGLEYYLRENFDIKTAPRKVYENTSIKDKEVDRSLPLIKGKIPSNEWNYQEQQDNRVAIVGINLKVPRANNKFEFWENMKNNIDCISEIPSSIRMESNLKEGKVRKAGFVDDVDKFDAEFFHISNREAIYMDPQQRLIIESVWGVFEDAGYRISELSGSRTGVFLAAATHDYADLIKKYDPSTCEAHISTGISNAMIANRISYMLNFHGPSEVIDTACSGSLVSLHRAVSSIQSGESIIAIAGGVNLNLSMSTFDIFEAAGMLSEDGECRTLDDSANGYVRGEGVGTVLLKSLKQAIADGNHIYGIVSGSAVNHGGRANSLTAPNVNAQADVIERAFEKAKVDVDTIGYVELHGTGTSLGDPIEIKGLTKAFQQLYAKDAKEYQPKTCGIGSIKTSIGHLESAAGVVGLIKVLLSMENGLLPALLHFKKLNQYITMEDTPFYVIDKNQTWERKIGLNGEQIPRRACISSFGFGGTNAHIIVEEYLHNSDEVKVAESKENLILLSAMDRKQLELSVHNLVSYIEKNRMVSIHDMAYTLCVGREFMPTRIAIIAKNNSELLAELKDWLINKRQTGSVYYREYKDDSLSQCANVSGIEEIAQRYVSGAMVSWNDICKEKGHIISLPNYPFRAESYWLNAVPKRAEKEANREEITIEEKKLAIRHTINPVMYERINDKIQLRNISVKQEESLKQEILKEQDLKVQENVDIKQGQLQVVNYMMNDTNNIKGKKNVNLIDDVKKILADILFCDVSKINVNTNFVDLGLDSILSVEFVKTLNNKLGSKLNTVLIYDYSTVEKLAQYLSEHFTMYQAEDELISVKPEENILFEREVEKTDSISSNEIKKILADILFTDVNKIDDNIPFQEMGLDSILCVEFVKKINSKYNTNLSTTTIYDNVCVSALTKVMNEQYYGNKSSHKYEDEKEVSVESQQENSLTQDSWIQPKSSVVQESRIQPESSLCSNDKEDDIAIIGLALRTAGAENQDEFWLNIRNGVSSVSVIPSDRWKVEEYYDSDETQEGKMYCKWGAFMKNADKFDSAFFGISPAEAKNLDPHQRVLMEEIWKSLEDAGYTMKQLDGMKCSIYTGISTGGEYPIKSLMNNHSISSARMSYFLNLKGEALSLDTACSSSMTALNLACQSLNNGFNEMAVAAGVSLFLNPEVYVHMCKAGMLSHIGKCSAFDNSADGFIPGEGVASVVVKKLSKAIKDNDHIYGVIKGIAMNQDGKTNGITAPSAMSQAELEEYVYKKSGINPETIDYIECHGTGTKLGDPIEITGLSESFSKFTQKKQFCEIGSVKTNVGHTASAAGLVGLIKVLLAMKNNEIPPTKNYSIPNEHIDFSNTPFHVNTDLKKWNSNHVKRAAVSSFGMSGTNVHAIIEEYKEKDETRVKFGSYAIPLSAKTKEALLDKMNQLQKWLIKNETDLSEFAYTLSCCRTHFQIRTCMVVKSKEELITRLGYTLADIESKNSSVDDILWNDKVRSIQEIEHIYGEEKIPAYMNILAKKYCLGEDINWNTVYEGLCIRKISIPGYVFEKKSFPIYRAIDGLGNLINSVSNNKDVYFMVDENDTFIRDNVAYGSKVMSTMGYLEYIRKAVNQIYHKSIVRIGDLRAYNVLWVNQQQKIKVVVEERNECYLFSVYSAEGNVLYVKGKAYESGEMQKKLDLDEIKYKHSILVDGNEILTTYKEMKHFYGKGMQSLSELYFSHDNTSYLAKISLPACVQDTIGQYYFHPSLLEGVVQAIGAQPMCNNKGNTDKLMSFGFESLVQFEKLPEVFYVYCKNNNANPKDNIIRESGLLLSQDGTVIGEIKDFMVCKLKEEAEEKSTKEDTKERFNSEVYKIVQELLEIDSIKPNTMLSEYGFSSLSIIDLISKINQKYQVKMEVDSLMEIDDLTSRKIADKVYQQFKERIDSFYEKHYEVEQPKNSFGEKQDRDIFSSMPVTKQGFHTVSPVAIIGVKFLSLEEIKKHGKELSKQTLLSVVRSLLDDAAYTKEMLTVKDIGVIVAKSCLKENDIVDLEGNIVENVAHAISDYFGFCGISEVMNVSENSTLMALNRGINFVSHNTCEVCISVGYSSKGIYATMLKSLPLAIQDKDNIYCYSEYSKYGYKLSDNYLKTEVKKWGNDKSLRLYEKQCSDDLEAVQYTCFHTKMEKDDFNLISSVENMRENYIYCIQNEQGEERIAIDLSNKEERMILILKPNRQRIDDKKSEKKEEKQIIIMSSPDEISLYGYVNKIISFIESKAIVIENKTSIFKRFDKELYELVHKKLKVNQGQYIAENLEGVIADINEKFHLKLSTQDFLKAPSLGQFIKYVYNDNKSKVKQYYSEKQKKEATDYDFLLEDMAYTLQIGRENLDYRLAIIASTPRELLDKLLKVNEKETTESVYQNNIHKNNIAEYQVFEGDDGKKIVEYIVSSNNIEKLASIWSLGVDVDWTCIPKEKKGIRMSLPSQFI